MLYDFTYLKLQEMKTNVEVTERRPLADGRRGGGMGRKGDNGKKKNSGVEALTTVTAVSWFHRCVRTQVKTAQYTF